VRFAPAASAPAPGRQFLLFDDNPPAVAAAAERKRRGVVGTCTQRRPPAIAALLSGTSAGVVPPRGTLMGDAAHRLTGERNLSHATAAAYMHDARVFDTFCRDHGHGDCTDVVTMRAFVADLSTRGMKSKAIARKISALRTLFSMLMEEGHVAANPAVLMRTPRHGERLPKFLTENQTRRMLGAPDRTTVLGARNHAIMCTLLLTGIRLSELVSLTLGRVRLAARTMRVIGKGNKERETQLDDSLVKVLRTHAVSTYTAILETAAGEPLTSAPVATVASAMENVNGDLPLFVSRKSRQALCSRAVQHMLMRTKVAANLPDKTIHPHMFRHTFAHMLHQNGSDLLEIQALLGHSSITSSVIYVSSTTAMQRRAIDALQSGLVTDAPPVLVGDGEEDSDEEGDGCDDDGGSDVDVATLA
jgi:site-specific recombinase XerD